VQNGVDELINQFKMELDTSVDYISFGKVLNKLNKMSETEKYYEVLLKMLSFSPRDMAKIFYNLGNAYFLQKQNRVALEYYEKALANCDHPDLELMSEIHCGIGRLYQSRKDYEKALECFTRSTDIASYTGSQSSKLVAIYNSIGNIYLHQNKYDLALDNFKLALNIALQILPSGHPFIGQCLHNIGNTHLHEGTFDLAIFHFNLALDKALRYLPSEHPFIEQCLNDIASLAKRNSEVDHVATATERLQISSEVNDQYNFTSSTKEFQSLSTSDDEYFDPST
jgi:tetratricopeptide (TPR) repeat protein